MAALPKKDTEVLELLRQIVVGVTANPTLWVNPPVDTVDITGAADDLEAAMQEQATKKAQAEQATVAKGDKLLIGQNINSRISSWAKSIVGSDDPRLNELGLSGPSPATPLQPPAQPVTLESCNEKTTGEFELRWKPGTGGGAVATFKLFRRTGGTGAFALFNAIAGNKSVFIVTGQPLDTMIEMYLVASNNAGDSVPSNTVSVKL